MLSLIWRQAIVSILIGFISLASNTYGAALFLSTYPPSWIPYAYIAGSVFSIIFVSIMLPMLRKNLKLCAIGLGIFFIILFLILNYIISLKYYWTPFILSVLLFEAPGLIGNVFFSIISLSLDLREYKDNIQFINGSGIIFGTLFGLSMPIITDLVGSSSLIYFICIFIFGLLLIAPRIKLLAIATKKEKIIRSPFRYKLFIIISVISIMYITVTYFSEYMLRAQLSIRFTKDEISNFMGIFLAVCNILSFGGQVGTFKKLAHTISVSRIIILPAFFYIIFALLILIHPGLITVTLLMGSVKVMYRSFSRLSLTALLYALPEKINYIGRAQLDGIIRPIVYIIAPAISIVLIRYKPYITLPVLIVACCVVIIALIQVIHKYYIETLYKSIRLKRYSLPSDMPEDTFQAEQQKVALESIKLPNISQKKFGLDLLSKLVLRKPPNELIELLNSDQADIRGDTVNILAKIKNPKISGLLKKLLYQESDPKVILYLLRALEKIDKKIAYIYSAKNLNHRDIKIKSIAAAIISKLGKEKEKKEAEELLKTMANSTNPDFRESAAQAMQLVDPKSFQTIIDKLIQDKEINVQVNILQTISQYDHYPDALIKNIVKALATENRYFVKKILLKIGEPAILSIYDFITKSSTSYVSTFSALKTISSISGINAEQALINLTKTHDIIRLNMLSKCCLMYAAYHKISEHFRKYFNQMILFEMKNIKLLRQTFVTTKNEIFQREIKLRETMSIYRYLHWIAICIDPVKSYELLPILSKMSAEKTEISRAIEFFETASKDYEIKKTIAIIFEEKTTSSDLSLQLLIDQLKDEWLKKINDYLEKTLKETMMEKMHIATFLRSVELFKELPGEVLLALTNDLEKREIYKDEVIFNEGDEGNGLFIVYSGGVEIIRDNKIIAKLKEGDFFGELALLDNAPRLAAAIAKSEGVLLYLDRQRFDMLSNELPVVLKSVIHALLHYLREYWVKKDTSIKI